MADKVFKYEDQMVALTDDQLKAKKQLNLKNVIKMENHWIHCFMKHLVVVREGAKRVPGLFPYKVQVMGESFFTMVTFQKCVQGREETLTATMPVYPNALQVKVQCSHGQ